MSLRSLRALCLTSFFIADVRDGLGPFLGIFLTQRHWQAEDIGLLMSVGGIAGLLATLPAGRHLSHDQQQLVDTLVEQLTATLALDRHQEKQQQLIVMEERASRSPV